MSNKIEIELNSNCIVQNHGIHDAAIIETGMSGEGDNLTGIIRCRSESGSIFVFHIEGILFFSVNFFSSQNIISDCLIINKRDAKAPLSEIKDIERYTFEKYDTLNERIKKGELTLLQLIPSVGANIDCICKTVTLEIG